MFLRYNVVSGIVGTDIVFEFVPMEPSLRYLLKLSAIMMWLLIPVMVVMAILIVSPSIAVDKVVSTIGHIFQLSV